MLMKPGDQADSAAETYRLTATHRLPPEPTVLVDLIAN
jgi:hypothetical protein